jgi:hypothetical protein
MSTAFIRPGLQHPGLQAGIVKKAEGLALFLIDAVEGRVLQRRPVCLDRVRRPVVRPHDERPTEAVEEEVAARLSQGIVVGCADPNGRGDSRYQRAGHDESRLQEGWKRDTGNANARVHCAINIQRFGYGVVRILVR